MSTIAVNETQLLVTVSDPSLITKLKNAIKMLNGVSSISVLKQKKSNLDMAREEAALGKVTEWNSVDEMFNTLLKE